VRKADRTPFFDRLADSLDEARSFTEGEVSLRAVSVPGPPPGYSATDVVRVRESLNLSRGLFAQLVNVSPRTVERWESGARCPAPPVRRLLQLIESQPAAVGRL
jgi:putative transcriptional regulator